MKRYFHRRNRRPPRSLSTIMTMVAYGLVSAVLVLMFVSCMAGQFSAIRLTADDRVIVNVISVSGGALSIAVNHVLVLTDSRHDEAQPVEVVPLDIPAGNSRVDITVSPGMENTWHVGLLMLVKNKKGEIIRQIPLSFGAANTPAERVEPYFFVR